MDTLVYGIILSVLPIGELRAGIPVAIAGGTPILTAAGICTLVNILIIPVIFLFLNTLHKLFMRIGLYRKLFDRIILKIRHKIEHHVNTWGYIGLMLFVAIPLPGSGAYTGCLGAWVLGLNQKKSSVAIALGVIIAAILVTIISANLFGLARLLSG